MGHTSRKRDVEAGKKVSGTNAIGVGRVPYFAPEGSGICGELSKWDIETGEYTRAACSRRALSCTKYSEPAGALVASGRTERATARREDLARRDMFGSSPTTRVAPGRVENWISDRLRLKGSRPFVDGGDASHRYT